MKISARNVFKGTVASVKEGPISAEVELVLASGDRLVASITEGSAQSLGIAPGTQAIAIIKAPLVLLATEPDGWKFTTRNQFAGTVAAIEQGAINASVTVALAGGATITSVVTNGAVDDLALAVGSPVTALFKAASVILGLPA